MAHACDYQSQLRTRVLTKEKQAILQAKAFANRNPDWSEKALKEYCLMAYGGMGLTEKLYYNNVSSLFPRMP